MLLDEEGEENLGVSKLMNGNLCYAISGQSSHKLFLNENVFVFREQEFKSK